MTPPILWRRHPLLVSPPVPLGELMAQFHEGSGESHLLTRFTSRVLDALRDGPLELAELASRYGLAAEEVAAGLLDLFDAGLVVEG